MLPAPVKEFLAADVVERFLRYVQVHTTSDESSATNPSTERQWDLLRMLESECREIGLSDVLLSGTGYVYATLPASPGAWADAFGLLAHVDTSPEQPGDGVRPVRHRDWDGSPIRFADDPALTLTPADCPELAHFVGDTILTASGRTLLGADDKAGVAEIMAALAAFRRFPELPHPRIVACFTSDEEIGRGTTGIELERLPTYCYTIDGGYPGELETECFDAWRAELVFRGHGVHPGSAKGRMVNAAVLASRYVASLPPEETPERTEDREGFYYVSDVRGDVETAHVRLIVRDFDPATNRRRLERLEELRVRFERENPGLSIELATRHQYENMKEILDRHPEVVERARGAIEDTGLAVVTRPIRGGTDGSLLCRQGHPTPNIFSGGMLFHSKKEWIAESALARAAEVIVHLGRRWAAVQAAAAR